MEKRNTKKRAFTLAELAVVLAVIAIATTMVVSFTALVGNRRAVAQAKLDALNDIKVAEALIENHIEYNGNTGISFDKGDLTVGTNAITLEKVTGIQITPDGNSENTLYYCTVTYSVAGENETYTFCVLKGGNS